MPPRIVTVVILALWLVMLGLFLYGDLWPRLAPAEPLLFPVDIVDEAGDQRNKEMETSKFAVVRNDTNGYKDEIEWPYRAEVEWRYHREDDSFESNCKLMVSTPPVGAVPTLVSVYRLTRAGQMKAMETTTEYFFQESSPGLRVQVELTGSPHNGQFIPHIKRSVSDAKAGSVPARESAHTGEAVGVSHRGIVLNPLHPPRRFTDLGDGQRWQLTVLDLPALFNLARPVNASQADPVSEADVAAGARAYVVEARVDPEIVTIAWQNEKEVPCRVIRCSDAGLTRGLTFWVRQRDGTQSYPGYKAGDVMQLDVTLGYEQWRMLRLPPAYRMRSIRPK